MKRFSGLMLGLSLTAAFGCHSPVPSKEPSHLLIGMDTGYGRQLEHKNNTARIALISDVYLRNDIVALTLKGFHEVTDGDKNTTLGIKTYALMPGLVTYTRPFPNKDIALMPYGGLGYGRVDLYRRDERDASDIFETNPVKHAWGLMFELGAMVQIIIPKRGGRFGIGGGCTYTPLGGSSCGGITEVTFGFFPFHGFD